VTQDMLSLRFSALGDPTRRAMLVRLSKGEASVSELAKPFMRKMSAPAITKHLQVLERAGLISKGREAQWRPCKLNGESFKEVSQWLELYKKFWDESLDRLDVYLKTLTAAAAAAAAKKKDQKKDQKNKKKKTRTKDKKNGKKRKR